MELADVVVYGDGEVLFGDEVLEEGVVYESLVKLLSVQWDVLAGSGFVLEFLLFY